MWEAWTVLAALAEATKRVELGTLVLCAAFRNPALVAKMAVALDSISGGRFTLGLGAGWNEPEFRAFGMPFDQRVDRFAEALAIIQPLLKTGQVDFAGRFYQARNCVLRPRGPRSDGPPLLVASFGPRMLRLTAQYADQWNTAFLSRAASLAEPRAALERACADVGRDPATLGVTATVALTYPDLAGELRAVPDPYTKEYLTGTVEEIAAVIGDYATLGVSHLMFHCLPANAAVFARLAESLRLYRATQPR